MTPITDCALPTCVSVGTLLVDSIKTKLEYNGIVTIKELWK